MSTSAPSPSEDDRFDRSSLERDAPVPEDAHDSTDIPDADGPPADEGAHVETAGAFDIRVFIGTLIGLFGLIITAMGLFAFGPEESARTDGLNANLWAGLVMIAVSIAFVVWARLDPIRMLVQENEPGAEEPRDISAID